MKYQPTTTFTRGFNFLIEGSLAVNDHNNRIYVADSGSGKVLNFASPTDTSPNEWDGSNTPAKGFGGHVSVAVDNSNGDVYVADGNHQVIDKFDQNGNLITSFGDTTPSPNGQLAGTTTPAGSFNANASSYTSWGIAVDQVTHDLYVIDAQHQVIDIFDENGTYLRQIAIPNSIFREGGSYLTDIAVDNSGTVYVADWAGPNLVYEFDSSGNYVKTLDGSNTPQGNFSGNCTGCSLINVAVQNSTGDLFVGDETLSGFDVFDSSGNFLPPQGVDPGFFGASALTIDQATGLIYAASYGSIVVFEAIIVPDVTVNPVSELAATTVTLSGHVDPAGAGNITDCHFEVDTSSGTKSIPCSPAAPISSPTDVSAEVTGLAPGTPYNYRLIAADANGSNQNGGSFTTVGHYQLSKDIGSAGSGAGQFNNPQDVAVDNSTGDLYVADTGNHRVEKFDSSGNFISAWGWGVKDGNATSEICTSGCQTGIAGSGAGQFTTPTFIAVDNSTDASAGDVYVADTADNVVQKFGPSGNLITSWGTGGATSYSGGIAGIAVDLRNGSLVVQPGSGNGIALDSFGNVYGGTIAIDTSTNDRYYSDGTQIQQFTTSSGCDPSDPYIPCAPSDTFGNGNLSSAAGLSFNPSNSILYVANPGSNNVVVFAPLPLPAVTSAPVESPGATSVTLTGHVDPNGGTSVTDCHFEYGTDATYSLGSVPCTPATPISSPTDVSANLTGLTPFTTYHFRLVAAKASSFDLPAYSRDRTFMPGPSLTPAIDATSFSDVTQTTVTFGAQINPNMSPTIYQFEYGTDTSYGSHTLAGDSIGSDGVVHSVSNGLSGLEPGTSYHFRVVAVNLNGVADGPDRTFTTPALPSVAATASSDVTQTTAKLSASVRPGFRPTTYHFEYGLTDQYGSSTPESASIGTDNAVYPVSASISNLSPLTLYHFRIVATNEFGSTDGSDQTFATAASSPPPPPPPPPVACKKGFVEKHGRCVKVHHHKPRHHKRLHHRRGH